MRRHAPLRLRYEVYAYDTSVRAAFLDARRGFFNGTSLFLRVQGRRPSRTACASARCRAAGGWPRRCRSRRGAHTAYRFAPTTTNWSTTRWRWAASGAASFSCAACRTSSSWPARWPSFDGERLLADTRRICETQIDFWHGRGKPPMPRYVFMLNTVEDGYGGLEHRGSTALIAARRICRSQGVADGERRLRHLARPDLATSTSTPGTSSG